MRGDGVHPTAIAPEGAGRVTVADYRAWLALQRGFWDQGYEVDFQQSATEIARSFLEQRRERDGKPIVGATIHRNFFVLPEAFEAARYIFIHRDPRDVAHSSVNMGWHGSGWSAAMVWKSAQDSLDRLKDRISPDQLLEIRFENLVQHPNETLSEVCSFLGETFTAQMLDIEKDTTYARPNPDRASSWVDNLPDRFVRQVETRLGKKAITDAGYPVSDLPPINASPLSIRCIMLGDFYQRSRFRWARYGFGLWLLHGVARRVPWLRVRKLSRDRINEIDKQFLK